MENIGNFVQNYLVYILAVFSLFLLILLFWNLIIHIKLKRFQKRNEEFFSGNKVSNLEELLLSQAKNLKVLDKDIQELYDISNQINALSLSGYHKLGMVRFNPFKDVGGNQSFSLALLNGKNNGFTLSSLFTREGARVYSKSILAGVSEKHPLTEEEKEAIKIAIDENNKQSK
jgi:hypothetical protein